MYKCKICEQEFEVVQKLASHYSAKHRTNDDKKKTAKKISNTAVSKKIKIKKQCEKCGAEFEVERVVQKNGNMNIPKKERRFCSYKCSNSKSFTQKQNRKKGRSKEENHNYKGGKKRWKCKECGSPIGKTKYGYCKKCLYNCSFIREKFSKIAIENKIKDLENGNNKEIYTKCILEVNNERINCDSKLEAAGYLYLLLLDEKNINRNKNKVEYSFEGIKYNYLPDFITDNYLVEIKSTVSNYQSKRWRSYKEKIPSKKEALKRKAEELGKIPLWIDRNNKLFNKIYYNYFIKQYNKIFEINYEDFINKYRRLV